MSKVCKKRVHGKGGTTLPWALKKCTRSLYFTLLSLVTTTWWYILLIYTAISPFVWIYWFFIIYLCFSSSCNIEFYSAYVFSLQAYHTWLFAYYKHWRMVPITQRLGRIFKIDQVLIPAIFKNLLPCFIFPASWRWDYHQACLSVICAFFLMWNVFISS